MFLDNLQGHALMFMITFASGSGFALFGYDQGVFGAFLGNANFIETFNDPDPTLQGQITATYDLGCFAGAIFAMLFGDRIGRKLTIAWGCAILVAGAVMQSAALHVPVMIIGRFIAGIGNGMNTTAIPVWQSETADSRYRGKLMVLQLGLNQVGNVTAQWLNYGMSFIATNAVSWRSPLAFQCFFAVLTVMFLPWLPDSPRWLAMRGRHDEAYVVLKRLGGSNRPEGQTKELYDLMMNNLRHEAEMPKFHFKSLFKNDRLQTTRRMLLGAGTQFMQQFGGINVVNYYLPVVFASLGVGRNLSLILGACNAINLLCSTLVGALYIESLGRKKMMVYGAGVQALCFALVSAGLAINSKPWQAVAVAFIFGYYTTFGLSWIAVPWLYPAEVNTQQMRIAGAGIATATNWMSNYIVVLVTPVGISNIQWKYYLIYAVSNAVFVFIVQFFYVETAKLTLEGIDDLFEKCVVLDAEKAGNEGVEKDAQVFHVDDSSNKNTQK
ncbi:hypothetical protein FSARC_11591 [Fusarium sarcochroum]|uniref:Major facilitator superfamily (MFS) profile domain-containing protein n=1 Tax=Fusarium sarcochroum TaxID=1208366 RepID=A0A8H4X0D0_9HYPO|nr:hypothetical protein FSARC_11591 [Fusarium sarcochroum]